MTIEELEERVAFLEQALVAEKIQAGEAIAANIALVAFVLDRVEQAGGVRTKESVRQLEIWAKSFEGTNPLASQMMRSLATSLERKKRAGFCREEASPAPNLATRVAMISAHDRPSPYQGASSPSLVCMCLPVAA